MKKGGNDDDEFLIMTNLENHKRANDGIVLLQQGTFYLRVRRVVEGQFELLDVASGAD